MEDIRSLFHGEFLVDLLNGLSMALKVQCALLSEHGKPLVFSKRYGRIHGSPYDIADQLVRQNWLSHSGKAKWDQDLQNAVSEAIMTGRSQSVYFDLSPIKLVQLVAPIVVTKDCVGSLASGKIPVGTCRMAKPVGDGLNARTDSISDLGKMILSGGVLPENAVADRLHMMSEFASMASLVASQNRGAVQNNALVGRLEFDFKALNRVIHSINRSNDDEEILRVIVQEGSRVMGADLATIALFDKLHNELYLKATAPPEVRQMLPRHRFGVNEGIKGLVFREHRTVLVKDLEEQERYRRIYVQLLPGIRSELAVPLKTGTGVVGVLNVESRRPNAFGRNHAEALEMLAGHVVAALSKVELVQSQERQLLAFSRATSKLGPQFELGGTLRSIVHNAVTAVNGSVGNIKLYNDRARRLEFREIMDFEGKPVSKGAIGSFEFKVWGVDGGPDDSLSAWTFRHARNRLTTDAHAEPLWRSPPWNVGSCIHVPLMSEKRCIGVLVVDGESRNAFSQADVRVLRLLANEAVMAIENQWHHRILGRIGSFIGRVLQVPFEQDPAGRRASVLSELARIVWEEMKPRACSVIIPHESAGSETPVYHVPDGCEYGIVRRKRAVLAKGRGLYWDAVSRNRIVATRDILADDRFPNKRIAKEFNLSSAISVPIKLGHKPFGAFNYYSSYKRGFTALERHVLQTICGIAGFIVSATETEKVRRESILDSIGTGITLIGLPPDWERRKRALKRGDPNWNRKIRMPLLFINKIHAERYSPGAIARKGWDCYKAFNNVKSQRPCWWCPVLRAMITGKTTTYFTHSPVLPKRRIEHFKVTASVYREGKKPVAAIESTVPVTRELEQRNFTSRILYVNEEDRVLDLAAECLGRGTRADCVLITNTCIDPEDIRFEHIYRVDRKVLKTELMIREWSGDTALELPPADEYFRLREMKSLHLFRKLPHYDLAHKRPSQCANEILGGVLRDKQTFCHIPHDKLLSFFNGTGLLHKRDFPRCESRRTCALPRSVVLRVGTAGSPSRLIILLDKKPREYDVQELDHEEHWCNGISSGLATKLESVYSHWAAESSAKLRKAIFERAPVAVVRTDANGEVVEVNPAWQRMIPDDVVGKNLLQLEFVRNAGLDSEFRAALRGREVRIEQRRLSAPAGQELVLSIRCVPMGVRKGSSDGILVICWDITRVAKRFEELTSRNELLVLGNLAAGATHEMKHPAIAAEQSIGHVVGAISRLLKSQSRLCKRKPTSGDWLRLREFADNALRWARPGAASLEEASGKVAVHEFHSA